LIRRKYHFLQPINSMKKIIITLLCAAFLSVTAVAQVVPASQVPAVVKKTFLSKFTKTSDLEWEKKGTDYLAQFVSGNAWMSATFSAAGLWLETTSAIESTALPVVVSSAIKKAYPGWEINAATVAEKANVGKQYEVLVDKDNETYNLLYKADGTFISKTKVEYEEDDFQG
jgi:hypothetical protein